MTSATQENPWDTMVPTYRRWAEPVSTRVAEALLTQAELPASTLILDVAAGTGALSVPAARCGHRVKAIDTSSGMVQHLNERLREYAGSSAEVMDAVEPTYADAEFDAAFSVFAVQFLQDAAGQAVSEMVRAVRPGGVVGLAHWADAIGSPYFAPVARAVDRLDDPEVGKFVPAISAYLTRAEVEDALRQAGCVDVRSETIEVESPPPSAETFAAELGPLFVNHPQWGAALSHDRDRFLTLLAEEVRADETSTSGHPKARATIAIGVVPAHPDR